MLGDWDNPYLTMAYRNEADEIRALGMLLKKGYVYRGLKPVNWCFDCGSALAEAEVEYEDRRDPAVDVGFPFVEPEKIARAFGLPALPDKPGLAVIWTTTPWTLPANQALNVHPEISYNLVDTAKGLLILAADLQETCLARYGLEGRTLATCKGAALERIAFHHPFYERLSPVYLAEYVTLETGTGIVHSAPAYGVEDFQSCRRYGLKDDEILTPVLGTGKYAESLPLFGGMMIWKANPQIVAHMAEKGVLLATENHVHSYMHCWRHKTPIIYRATTQWFVGNGIAVQDLATPNGKLSYSVRRDDDALHLTIHAGLRVPPGGLVFPWPYAEVPGKALSGNRALEWHDGELRIRQLPADIVIAVAGT